ncbi:glycosyltransferase involved in cell wall biosynthesis [Peribacillus sp. B2I2]|uniref:glycosyltransferase family 2 protein n=1 Tax=Peribacillus sp. B2I2 TaxID=3156468 RepID=UPI0035134577
MIPKVSVIVPVFNNEKYISKCLESILSQSYRNIEVVIVNDGSTDKSENVIKEYRQKDERILYLSQINSGPSEARNKGIVNSTGEYLVFIDSDDTVDKYYIEFLLNSMINSKVDLVCCGYKDYSKYGIIDHTDFNVEGNIPLNNLLDMICAGTGGVLWSKIFKKEIISKNNLRFNKNIYMSEDLIFTLEYVTHSRSFKSIKKYLYHYNRLNENSISANISIKHLENSISVCGNIEKVLSYVNYDKKKINNIITERMQNAVLNTADYLMSNEKRKVPILREVLDIPYIKKCKYQFSTKKVIYKPYIYFLKKDLLMCFFIYGALLNKMKYFKFEFIGGGSSEKSLC